MEIPLSAAQIFGRDYLDPTVVNNTYTPLVGRSPTPTDHVEIELEKARLRGEFPIQRSVILPDGQPKTMYNMVKLLQEIFEQQNWGQILYAKAGDRWYQDEGFFMQDTPRPGWALVSKEPIAGSTKKNYHQQTADLDRLVTEVYQNRTMPVPYQEALQQWVEERGRLEKSLYSDPIGTGKALAVLDINRLLREQPVEVLDGMLVLFNNTGERRLRNVYTWTSAVLSGGYLVSLGYFGPGGVDVYGWDPDSASSGIGVCSNRSYL